MRQSSIQGTCPLGRGGVDQDQQLRTKYYRKLGIAQDGVAPQLHKVSSPTIQSCLKRKPSVLHIANPKKRVSFFEKVLVISIQSHRDYDDETRDLLYNTKANRERRALQRWEQEVMRDIYKHIWMMDNTGITIDCALYPTETMVPPRKSATKMELPSYKSLQSTQRYMSWSIPNPNEAAFAANSRF
jgi:hypothetical protein